MKTKIYILHGWSYSKDKWKPFLEILEKQNIEAVMLDIPGLTAKLDKVWDIDDYVQWLENIVHKEKDKIILLGHSNGGRICLAYTLAHQGKVKQLILIDSAGIYHNELPIRVKRFVFGTVAKIGKPLANISLVKKLFYKVVREHDYEKASPVVKETMKNLITTDLSKDLHTIHLPTTLIWGENDMVTPLSDGKIFEQAINNASLYTIPSGRHSPMFTHPDKVAHILFNKLLK